MNVELKQNQDITRHRVITLLERDEVEFLDKLGKDALFSTGHKLSYNEILKGLIDIAMETGVSGDNINSLDTFKERLLSQIRQMVQKEESKKLNPNRGAK